MAETKQLSLFNEIVQDKYKNEGCRGALDTANEVQDDEFYTQYSTVETELKYYHDSLRGATIWVPCDNPATSNFWKYLYEHFHEIGLKKLIATYLDRSCEHNKTIYDGSSTSYEPMEGDGDYRGIDARALWLDPEVWVITNPPFSLFRDLFINYLMKYNKRFLILGGLANCPYKGVNQHIVDGEVWTGATSSYSYDFLRPDGSKKEVACYWYTNIKHKGIKKPFKPTEKYDETKYKKYFDVDALFIDKMKDVPYDYDGVMAVPLTLLRFDYQREYELLGCTGLRSPFFLTIYHELRRGKCIIHKKNGAVYGVGTGGLPLCLLSYTEPPTNKTYYTKPSYPGLYFVCPFCRLLIRKKIGSSLK